MKWFAVFIADADSVEEFVGLARVNTQADTEEDAKDRAVLLHAEHTGRSFTVDDVALCAEQAPVTLPVGARSIRMF